VSNDRVISDCDGLGCGMYQGTAVAFVSRDGGVPRRM
jgi:hypothetical protein